MKAQRITSAKFIWVRAPMINAPIRPKMIKTYMPSAERRVKSHINVSKFMPRCERDKLLGLALLILASQRRVNDDQHGDTKNGQEDRPLYPNGFTMMFKQFRPQVKNGDSQAIDGVEQHAEENKNLESPVLVNGVG